MNVNCLLKFLFVACIACLAISCSECSNSDEERLKSRKYRPWSEEIKASETKESAIEPITSSNEKAPRFSIGLGTLAPSYSQKFGNDGRTRLDFNQEKSGYSYSLSNVEHVTPSQTSTTSTTTKELDKTDNRGYNPIHYYQPGQPQFSIYARQSAPQPQPQQFYNQVPVVYGNLPTGQYPMHPLSAAALTYNNGPPFQPYFNPNYQYNGQRQNDNSQDIKSSAQQQSSTTTEPDKIGHSSPANGQQPFGYPLMNPLVQEYIRNYQMLQQAASLYPTATAPYPGQRPFLGQQAQISNNYGYNPYASYTGGYGYGGVNPSAAASNILLSILAAPLGMGLL